MSMTLRKRRPPSPSYSAASSLHSPAERSLGVTAHPRSSSSLRSPFQSRSWMRSESSGMGGQRPRRHRRETASGAARGPPPLHVPALLRVRPALLHAAPVPAAVLAGVEKEPAASRAALEAVERRVGEQLHGRVGEGAEGRKGGLALLPLPAGGAV